MESFDIIFPIPTLAPYIKYYWILEIGEGEVMERIIPSGYINLVFHRESSLMSSTHNELQPQAFICGQSLEFSDVVTTGKLNMLVVVFQPHAANMFFNTPVSEFYGTSVASRDVSDIELADLSSRIQDTMDNNLCIHYIEEFLIKRLSDINASNNYERVKAALDTLNNQRDVTVKSLAEIACLSYKQFSRVFTQYVGANPKEFSRIIRFQHALYTLQSKPSINLTQLSYESGFFDQSHLIKEFKAMSGYTPGEYLSVCAPHSDYFSTT